MLRGIRRSLHKKVIAVVLVATLAALLVSAVAFLAYEIDSYHEFLISDVTTQADILARTNAPAVTFNDRDSATASLAQLAGRPGFLAAAVYTPEGELFASYSRDGVEATFPPLGAIYEPVIAGDNLSLFHPIVENGNRVGTVYLQVGYALTERLRDYAAILAVVLLASFVVAALISLSLAGSVTKPILAVTRVAQRVITERDFRLRARKTTDDESGVLVDAFNAMLTEVDARQAALEASNAMLQRETDERRAAAAALQQADKRKDEFLATLAHELRNPLAPMVNAMSLLGAPDVAPEMAQRAREIVARQLTQLVRLVDDLLDVSRITSGKLVVHRKPVELASIVQSAIDTVRPQLDAHGHRLALSLPDHTVHVDADPVRLSQVFSNVLHNAIKYSDDGRTIAFSANVENGSKIRITIRDEGFGISAATLPHIFQMFSQGDAPSDRLQTGLGVGLALAQQLVELHDGTIAAGSAGPGKGSVFTIELPLGHAPTAEPESRSFAPAERPHRVLLVDDNVDFVASLAELLRMLGHTVCTAHDPDDALRVAREFEPEFGLLDLGLPRINGYELARKLRDQPETTETVLIAISGWGQPQDRQRSREAGFALHLVKPVELEEIRSALRSLTREKS